MPASHAHRRAAVLGSPIAHSRSPQLHLAAYRALGLPDWTYDRIECTAGQLPGLVSGLGPEWVGLSVTMPGKFAALAFADERTERAELVGSANTLVRTDRGWRADNTDVDGVAGALGSASGAAVVLGAGGTAPAAVVGLARLGVEHVTVAARNAEAAARLVTLARRVGMQAGRCSLEDSEDLAAAAADAATVVSTLPADAAACYARDVAAVPVLLDADLRSVADAAGGGGGRGGRHGDLRAADAAAPGLRAGRTIHRAAGAASTDGGRAGLACAACERV